MATILPVMQGPPGTFGLHILKNPANTFSFVGWVPSDLFKKSKATYEECVQALFVWVDEQESERGHYATSLRDDLFARYCERLPKPLKLSRKLKAKLERGRKMLA